MQRGRQSVLGATGQHNTRSVGTTAQGEAVREDRLDWNGQTTLRRAWTRDCPSPQCAFEMSMFNVSCNSHYFSQLAALFIDARAE